MSEQDGVVLPRDVEALGQRFEPGSVVESSTLYSQLSAMMGEQRRPLAHQTALGHALRREGWQRHRIRRRVGKVQQENAAWIVPGRAPVDEQSQQLMTALRSLGEGLHPEETIFERYRELTREHSWRWTLDELRIKRWLTANGFVRMTNPRVHGGKQCRFVGNERLAPQD